MIGRRPLRSAVGRLVDFVRVSERRRATVAVGIPLLFWLVVELAANLGFLPLVAAAGLSAYLYTRRTAQETLAASAYGTGLLDTGFYLLQAYRGVAWGSTASLADTVAGLFGWLLTGTILIVLGVWIHGADL